MHFFNSYKYISLIHTNTFSFCINDLLKTTPCTAVQKEQQGATFRIRNAFLTFFFIFANINFLGGSRFFSRPNCFQKETWLLELRCSHFSHSNVSYRGKKTNAINQVSHTPLYFRDSSDDKIYTALNFQLSKLNCWPI